MTHRLPDPTRVVRSIAKIRKRLVLFSKMHTALIATGYPNNVWTVAVLYIGEFNII
jgi:hypothetical protein